jgi:hypothetical protein
MMMAVEALCTDHFLQICFEPLARISRSICHSHCRGSIGADHYGELDSTSIH